MTEPGEQLTFARYLPCRNVGSTAIEKFKGLEITGADSDGTLQVRRARFTNTYSSTYSMSLAWNGPTAIPVDGYGSCTIDYPAYMDGVPATNANLNFEVI